MKTSGKPTAITMCIGPAGDSNHVPTGECAVRLARKGNFFLLLYGALASRLLRDRAVLVLALVRSLCTIFAQDSLLLSAQECK